MAKSNELSFSRTFWCATSLSAWFWVHYIYTSIIYTIYIYSCVFISYIYIYIYEMDIIIYIHFIYYLYIIDIYICCIYNGYVNRFNYGVYTLYTSIMCILYLSGCIWMTCWLDYPVLEQPWPTVDYCIPLFLNGLTVYIQVVSPTMRDADLAGGIYLVAVSRLSLHLATLITRLWSIVEHLVVTCTDLTRMRNCRLCTVSTACYLTGIRKLWICEANSIWTVKVFVQSFACLRSVIIVAAVLL